MTESLKDVSAIILAGGLSSRMGTDKAELAWNGVTLIEHQVKKMLSLGIDDVILSGYKKPISGTRCVSDVNPGKGPLGGIHTGLLAARHPHCLVLSVDVPLVPEDTLASLIDAHIAGESVITVLSHKGRTEPLIGIYERGLSALAEEILQSDNTSVRVLFEKIGAEAFEYAGDEVLLLNCNTPTEYSTLRQYTEQTEKPPHF